ncbi:MAG TPA: diguanylate cyclase [Thermoanaerobaculia bacterium]|jgi:diguanylate cyclase (GGDEF)-like protein|nr:diguanylate cyclase [Thermoanaerobaculia bacterium]
MKTPVAGLLLALAFAAHAEHRGLPVLSLIPQSQHRGGAQTFDAAQDARGILYFGNLSGVITYDGAWWNTIALPNDSAVFAVESDAAGVVAAGGVGELGYLVSKPDGTLAYQSLLDQLPPYARDVGEVRGICTAGRGFVFATERFAIEWNGGAPRVLAQHRGDAPPTRCSTIDAQVHLWGGDGLWRVERGRLVPAGFDGLRLDAVLDAGKRIIAAVRDDGLQTLDNGVATPFAAEASVWLAGKRVTDATRLRDGRVAIATREAGLLILRVDGAIDEVLGPAAGLPDDVLLCALADREGALWLAYHGPLVRIDLASSVTVLDARRGLRGSARGLLEYDGKLWITTMRGLYVLEDAPAGARRIAGIDVGAWSLMNVGDDLFIGTTEGVFRMRGESAPVRIAGTNDAVVYGMHQSESDPSRIWLTTRAGVGTLRRDGDGWRYEGILPRTPRYARSILEVNGDVWVGTVFDGVVRIARDGKITRYGSGETDVASIGGRLVFVRYPGTVQHLAADGALAPDPLLGHIKGPPAFFRLTEDHAGNVWFNTDPPRVLVRIGKRYTRELRPLSGIGIDVQMMQFVDDAMWFGTTDGLYRYAPHTAKRDVAQPAPLIRRVVANTGDTLYSDGISTANSTTALRYAFRRLRIEFAPASYRPGVAYQYRLDPIDSAWSEWSSNPFIDYTHLDHGRYTFRLRTRGATGATSQESHWSFTVRPPWYRTPWTILLGLVAAAALVALIVKLRTCALARQAERLRELVDDRTRELAKTVDLLGEANQHLERLSLLDELTGIPNRRYFDRALAQTWEAASQTMQPLSMILLDLDHFKMLNDAKGHPAGDASLVQVARLLAQRIRRSGELVSRGQDVVARIGGEEFAVLLTNTDIETASRVAESLRASIQAMVIAFESSNLRVTVSCGVATTAPVPGGSPEALVRRADRALYDAKAAGRNCVREAAA